MLIDSFEHVHVLELTVVAEKRKQWKEEGRRSAEAAHEKEKQNTEDLSKDQSKDDKEESFEKAYRSACQHGLSKSHK